MLNTLKRFLAPPVFAEDAEKTRVARLLNVIILIVTGVFGVASLLLVLNTATWPGLLVLTPLFLWGISMRALLRARHVYGAARGFVLFLWVVITGIILVAGGVKGPETGGYILILVMAGMLGGVRMLLLFTALGVGAVVGIYWLEMAGFLPPPLFPPDAVGGLAMSIINSLLVCGVFYLALSSLQKAMALAHCNAEKLADKNRDLEAVRASLEEQVAARTQAAEAARAEAEAATAALQEQMWQILGLAQLSAIQPSGPGVVPMAIAALEHICRYVDAAVGALYLWEDAQLELKAGYACPIASSRNRRFALGEGLIGQVAAEGRPHGVAAQASSLTLASSFGEIALAQVDVYPLLYGGTVLGVLEIGGLTPFTAAQTQFLTQALERLVVILHTLQAQARINLLLQETQQQAEELQAQEEELRAANEELQAQTEVLRAQPARA